MPLKSVLVAGLLALCAAPAAAQAPSPFAGKQMRFIVPFPAGGTLDVLARTVSNELGPALGATIVVENRPGASGVLGADVVARAPADGSTLVIVSNTFVTLPAMLDSLPFDIVKNFAPVIELGGTPTLLTVHPSIPARDLKQFIAYAREKKDGVNYNSPGIASPPHLAGELFSRAANVPMVHVPYRGTQPAITDLVSGQMPVSMAPLNAVLQFVNNQQLYGIALTDAARTRYLPNYPDAARIRHRHAAGDVVVRGADHRRHAARPRGAPQQRDRQDPARPESAAAAGIADLRGQRRLGRGPRQADARGCGDQRQDRDGSQDQGAVRLRLIAAPRVHEFKKANSAPV